MSIFNSLFEQIIATVMAQGCKGFFRKIGFSIFCLFVLLIFDHQDG